MDMVDAVTIAGEEHGQLRLSWRASERGIPQPRARRIGRSRGMRRRWCDHLLRCTPNSWYPDISDLNRVTVQATGLRLNQRDATYDKIKPRTSTQSGREQPAGLSYTARPDGRFTRNHDSVWW